MTDELILTNARLLLRPGRWSRAPIVTSGAADRRDIGASLRRTGQPGHGRRYLIPGVVDVHTDNLERQVQPRSMARWPSRSAMVAHDAQCAAAGVTTVLDALCIGDLGFDG